MHVHGEEHLATNDKDRSGNTTSMANGGVDVRLRRQTPVSVKPPRLRLSATSSAIRKVSTSRLSAQTQQPSSPNENRPKSSGDSYSANAISGRCQNGAANIVPRSSRSSSVSKLSASSSCGRRIKGRSRAGITASTFTPTGSNGEPVSSFSSSHSASLSKVATFGLSRSCDNVGAAVFSTATFENGNSGRPLIHHQRHNLKNRFQLVRTIGEGTYGKVKLAADKSSGEQVC
ncbi:hypothetical protein RRG08_049152 [Elysia crispata]|uniref:Uncharacterized protein n=1 Tax=Elysia crispata TaxID=231223 RepID=A0AAE1ARB9_9GAST|nr:hypothetical protein RRG08_049152 [Elysia crispata]